MTPPEAQALEAFLRANFEPLTYLAFFGTFALFAVAEALWPRDTRGARRLERWPANWALMAITIALMIVLPISAIAAADWALANRIGLLNTVEMPALYALLAGFLLRGWISWLHHFLMHKIPFLWRIHRVHHMDTGLDTSSTVRFHPLEMLITGPFTVAAIVALGLPPLAILIYELLDASITVFSHSNTRQPRWLDQVLRLIIVTPDVHRVHHSSYQPETDSNYGAVLTVWDRVFFTYRSKPAEELALQENGLSEVQDGRSASLFWLIASPLLNVSARPHSDASPNRRLQEAALDQTRN